MEDEGGKQGHHTVGGIGVYAASGLHVVSGERLQQARKGENVYGISNKDEASI